MFSLTNHGEVGQVAVSDHVPTVVPLRPKNQMTLPAEIARALGATPGDRLLLTIDPSSPDTAVLRRIRETYFGALAGSFGTTHEEQLAYARGEQDGWTD